MPSAHEVFPDAEALVAYLIREGVLDLKVFSSIPSSPPDNYALVQRIGGSPVHRSRLDAADLQIDVFAVDKSTARRLALEARIAVMDAEGTQVTLPNPYQSVTGFITGVQDSMGLTWSPDPGNPPKDRYIFGLRVFLHA